MWPERDTGILAAAFEWAFISLLLALVLFGKPWTFPEGGALIQSELIQGKAIQKASER